MPLERALALVDSGYSLNKGGHIISLIRRRDARGKREAEDRGGADPLLGCALGSGIEVPPSRLAVQFI
jgi:hypothetical protein